MCVGGPQPQLLVILHRELYVIRIKKLVFMFIILIHVIYWCIILIVKLLALFVNSKYYSCRIKTNVVIFFTNCIFNFNEHFKLQ